MTLSFYNPDRGIHESVEAESILGVIQEFNKHCKKSVKLNPHSKFNKIKNFQLIID